MKWLKAWWADFRFKRLGMVVLRILKDSALPAVGAVVWTFNAEGWENEKFWSKLIEHFAYLMFLFSYWTRASQQQTTHERHAELVRKIDELAPPKTPPPSPPPSSPPVAIPPVVSEQNTITNSVGRDVSISIGVNESSDAIKFDPITTLLVGFRDLEIALNGAIGRLGISMHGPSGGRFGLRAMAEALAKAGHIDPEKFRGLLLLTSIRNDVVHGKRIRIDAEHYTKLRLSIAAAIAHLEKLPGKPGG